MLFRKTINVILLLGVSSTAFALSPDDFEFACRRAYFDQQDRAEVEHALDSKEFSIDDTRNWLKRTCLGAAAGGSLKFIRYLVEEKKAKVDVIDGHGDTPLMEACFWSEDPQVIEYLLERSDSVINQKKNSDTALSNLVRNKSINESERLLLVKKLVEKGAKIGEDEKTIENLFTHASWGDVSIMQFLLEDNNFSNYLKVKDNGKKLAFAAAQPLSSVNPAMFSFILNTIPPESLDESIIFQITEIEKFEIVLKKLGSQVLSSLDGDGNTALMALMAQVLHRYGAADLQTVQYLVELGINPHTKNKYGQNALNIAEGELNIVENRLKEARDDRSWRRSAYDSERERELEREKNREIYHYSKLHRKLESIIKYLKFAMEKNSPLSYKN